jgi:hypothetical protein
VHTHRPQEGNIMRSVHTMYTQLIPSLRHVWHSRRAQQHVLWILGAFGLTNRGSRGITGMVGERSTQTDDAVLGRRKATGCPTTRCSSIRWLQLPTAFSLVRSAHSRPSTQMQSLLRHGIGGPRADYTYQRVELLFTHTGAYAHPDRRRHTMGRNGAAPGRRLAATALPHLPCAARPCTVYLHQCSVL